MYPNFKSEIMASCALFAYSECNSLFQKCGNLLLDELWILNSTNINRCLVLMNFALMMIKLHQAFVKF